MPFSKNFNFQFQMEIKILVGAYVPLLQSFSRNFPYTRSVDVVGTGLPSQACLGMGNNDGTGSLR